MLVKNEDILYIQSPKNQLLSFVSKIDSFLLQTILQKIFHTSYDDILTITFTSVELLNRVRNYR